jgi:hypothetical protein
MENSILLLIFLSILVNAIVLYLIISFAVQPTRRDRYQSQQVNLLIKLCQKAGVSNDELNNIMKGL